jgi:thymidylate synthase
MTIKNRGQSIFRFRYDDFKLLNYDPHPSLPMEIAV